MSRRRAFWLPALAVVILALGALVHPGTSPEPTAGALAAEADTWFARGESLRAGTETGTSDRSRDRAARAAGAWSHAALRYRAAFRMLDPEPANRRSRALMAFRCARAFAEAARAGQGDEMRARRAEAALFWFGQALRLEPALRQVWYERAALRESEIPEVHDLERAREAYRRYLAAVEEAGQVPESERARVARARIRAEALAPR
jgi:tetratricopeptide (TPR) repeat protein